jgi:uncharacterized protein with PIN domain
MINLAECPKCAKRVLHVRIESAVATVDEESKGRCLTFSCIHCNTLLGVQMDQRSKPRRREAPRTDN